MPRNRVSSEISVRRQKPIRETPESWGYGIRNGTRSRCAKKPSSETSVRMQKL
ncbi:hypothetical protein [[Phormidium] sp. ETS-05]|uniref:hypothetical protein n=1 Tax=[Phormidium] sp. ETS-05 TaxID=222819 RepID=UPI0018EF16D5|nr:hypothetical protein [[Phormidium] sp. ETS-05]